MLLLMGLLLIDWLLVEVTFQTCVVETLTLQQYEITAVFKYCSKSHHKSEIVITTVDHVQLLLVHLASVHSSNIQEWRS